ncbi:UNVERIFIED_CONTAM: hypothetical protein Slati_2355200 [Sesamum latifolium]|uniref:Uncharacterized protein n=1 Tax=Sesamum latifolium TaxID=2727402 RepID=A0AAW2WEJ8_9LAMI
MEDSADSSGAAARTSVEQEETSTLMDCFIPSLSGKRIRAHRVDRREALLVSQIHGIYIRQPVVQIDRFVLVGTLTKTAVGIKIVEAQADQHSCFFWSGWISIAFANFPLFCSCSRFLRDGCWSKINFRGDETNVDQEEESKLPLANPWIQRYGTSQTQGLRKSQASCANAPSATTDIQHAANNFRLWRQDSIGGNTEVTDQNFNDESLEEEKSGKIHDMKKTRTTKDKVSGNDQVVPFGNILQEDDVDDHVNVP